MRLYHRKPAPPLDRFVDLFFFCDGASQPYTQERVLPTGRIQIIINLREDKTRIYDRNDFGLSQTFNGCTVVGPLTEFSVIDTEEQQSVAGICFKPGGAYPFFAPPADELRGLHLPLDCLWGSFASELRDRLLEAPAPDMRFAILENALLNRLVRPLERHRSVEFALNQFHNGPQIATIQHVRERTGLSARRFIELFRRETGFTPKSFCRVLRFQRALGRIASGAPVEWTRIALDSGYFDQAHFVHDFRAFSGINPSTYLQTPRRYTNHVPLA